MLGGIDGQGHQPITLDHTFSEESHAAIFDDVRTLCFTQSNRIATNIIITDRAFGQTHKNPIALFRLHIHVNRDFTAIIQGRDNGYLARSKRGLKFDL